MYLLVLLSSSEQIVTGSFQDEDKPKIEWRVQIVIFNELLEISISIYFKKLYPRQKKKPKKSH